MIAEGAAACFHCLRRTWLLEQMGGHLDYRMAAMIDVLELDDAALIGLTSGALRSRLETGYVAFGREQALARVSRAHGEGISLLCRCVDRYPPTLRSVRAAPAVLHVAGSVDRFLELCDADAVALVGSRSATAYGLEVAHTLARGASASGLSVVSGMAPGVDGAAHEGALAGGGRTIAVIPGYAARAYPRAQSGLHRRILGAGAVVSETGPGAALRRWMMPARNRIIAGLSQIVVLVQAAERSGAELTVMAAREYGRRVGAVPGSVLLEQSCVPNALLVDGATVIRHAQDVLDAVYGLGVRAVARGPDAELDESQCAVLEAISAGADTAAALARLGFGGALGLSALGRLELAGVIVRGAGGRYTVSR